MSEIRPHLEPRQALQDRVSSVILDAAARVLAAEGEQASMSDVAVAAGVARATVYRYFPTRQALLDRLLEIATTDARTRLSAARVHAVRPEEALRRAVGALLDVGDYFVVLARERMVADSHGFTSGIGDPLRRVVEQAQAAGGVRRDIPSSWLVEFLVRLVTTVVAASPTMGRDDMVDLVVSLFFDGARSRPARRQPRRST
jgi:TetR/AcrR family transcriptional regulator, mexCD-oprJ operon repressor